jgi:zinc protease
MPNNATLFIAGDVTLKDILPKLEKVFGDWKPGTVTPVSDSGGSGPGRNRFT